VKKFCGIAWSGEAPFTGAANAGAAVGTGAKDDIAAAGAGAAAAAGGAAAAAGYCGRTSETGTTAMGVFEAAGSKKGSGAAVYKSGAGAERSWYAACIQKNKKKAVRNCGLLSEKKKRSKIQLKRVLVFGSVN
jgi:hypothetical protein